MYDYRYTTRRYESEAGTYHHDKKNFIRCVSPVDGSKRSNLYHNTEVLVIGDKDFVSLVDLCCAFYIVTATNVNTVRM